MSAGLPSADSMDASLASLPHTQSPGGRGGPVRPSGKWNQRLPRDEWQVGVLEGKTPTGEQAPLPTQRLLASDLCFQNGFEKGATPQDSRGR